MQEKFSVLSSQLSALSSHIGLGEDCHWFKTSLSNTKKNINTKLILGGVKFSNYPPFKANSDGDVMIHSLCNAISSALGSKSLGSFADEICLNSGITDSKEFLKPLLKKLNKKNLHIQSVSFSLECLLPKIDPISDQLKKSLSKILEIPVDNIGITAHSGEKMTPFGQGKGIKCTCIVLLK